MAKKKAGKERRVPVSRAAEALRAAIADAQAARGLTNTAAAELAGIKRPNYVGYVHGETAASIEKLADIAAAFGVQVHVVIG